MTEATQGQSEWPERPWLMAAIGALGGLAIYLLIDKLSYGSVPTTRTIVRQAAAAGVAVATLAFLLTAERRRVAWAITFALGWGAVMALVGYSTGMTNRGGELVEYPFLSGLLAVAVAGPLFQTVRDEGRARLPYAPLHRYAWTDAIIGGASLAFTGLTFLLAFLLSQLFDAIGISLIKKLLDHGWFDWMVAGAAFGAASAVLRNREPLLGTLQRLVMLVFSVLAPVLAGALALFLLALPATGFAGLWKSGLPETPLLLSAAAFAFVFLNAIIGDSADDRGKGKLWRATEAVLLLAMLPLGLLALVSMGMRVGQYGWTPERLWGVVACLIAITYGAMGWWAGFRGRRAFDAPLREYQKRLAVGLCGLALFLALPIVDFGAISTGSQLARLEAGKVTLDKFDWQALAFDFGPAGRRALQAIARNGPSIERPLAQAALGASSRYEADQTVEIKANVADLDRWVRILPAPRPLDPSLRELLADHRGCGGSVCTLLFVSPDEAMLASRPPVSTDRISEFHFVRGADGKWAERNEEGTWPDNRADLRRAPVEVRARTYRQLYVDGKPVGPPFE